MSQPEPQTFDELVADMAAKLDALTINADNFAALGSGGLTVAEAAARLAVFFDVPVDDGVVDAPGVEYHIDGRSYNEYGVEIVPTLPFKRLR